MKKDFFVYVNTQGPDSPEDEQSDQGLKNLSSGGRQTLIRLYRYLGCSRSWLFT